MRDRRCAQRTLPVTTNASDGTLGQNGIRSIPAQVPVHSSAPV